MAMPSAFTTSDAAGLVSIDQPTTRRENVSKTTAQYTLPSRVGCSVISVTPKQVRLITVTALAGIPQSCSSKFPTLGRGVNASRFLLSGVVVVLGLGVF
jgi:hypothetical protein